MNFQRPVDAQNRTPSGRRTGMFCAALAPNRADMTTELSSDRKFGHPKQQDHLMGSSMTAEAAIRTRQRASDESRQSKQNPRRS